MVANRPGFGPMALAHALGWHADRRLAAYGSLRPGERHHDLVDDLSVVATGSVRGALRWLDGYPVLSIDQDSDADAVPVVVLGGDALADRWPALDRFEGPAYRREVVVVHLDGGGLLTASCYVEATDVAR
jgi:gamma-glutamylcyclotransferase (GGCT)/AIG2-like uncharacterized protein YtfP